MKITLIGSGIFLFILSVSAGTLVETFDDRNLEEWREVVQLNNAPGSWEIINNEFHAISRETFVRLLTTGDETWENYTVEFDVKPLKKHGIGAISIAARVKGTWVVYCRVHDPVVLMGDKPPIHEPRVDCLTGDLHDTLFILIGSFPHPLLKLNKWSHLKLRVENHILTFWVNGKQVMEPTKLPIPEVLEALGFPNFQTGGVGFGLANYTARFDSIPVTGDGIPNRGGLAVTPKGKLATTWGNLKRF